MANQKVYQITINGLTESVKAVDALTSSLENLEKRINALQSKSVNVGAKSASTGGGSKKTDALTEEEATEREINKLKAEGLKLDAKIKAAQDEIYKRVDATKELYKETIADQKGIAAQERLVANEYSNTMQGMKQHLADLKAVINSTDLGDSAEIAKMTEEAGKLTQTLKQMEEAYGQFGRNVGNYNNSLNGISVTIAGVDREFKNAKQAVRTLKQELDSLSASEKGNTNYAKELRREYNKLKSAIDDSTKSSKFMDEALDTMQSFTSLNQISQGFSTFFGVDNSEMERQIARLVALQNALQGLEKLNKQIDSEEGIGKWLAKGSRGVDEFITRVTGAEKKMGLFIGKTREASIRINAFSKILKGVGGVAITGGIVLLTDVIGKAIDKLKKWVTGGFEAGDATEILKSRFETLTNEIQRLQKENTSSFFNNMASDAAYLKNNLEVLSRQLVTILGEMEDLKKYSQNPSSLIVFDTKTLDDAQRTFEKLTKLISEEDKKRENSWVPNFFYGIKDAITGLKREYKDLGESLLNDFLYRSNEVVSKARKEILSTGKVSKDTADDIKELNKEINEKFSTNSILANVEKFSDKGDYYAKQIDFVKTAIQGLNNSVNEETLNPDYLIQLRIDSMKDGAAKIKAQNELNRKKEIEEANGNLEAIGLINKKFDHELQEQMKSINQQYNAALNDLNNLRIQKMREGLKKELEQLKQEKIEKIQAIVADGNLVGKRIEAVNELYDKKILEAKRDWAYEMNKVYTDLYSNIESITRGTFETEANTAVANTENKTAKKKAGAWSSNDNPYSLEDRKKYYQELLKIETDGADRIAAAQEEQLARELDFNKKEEELRHDRVADAKTTSLMMEELAKYESEHGVPLVPDESDEGFDWGAFEKKLQGQLANMRGELVDAYNEGKIDFKQFVKLIQDEQDAHNAKMNSLEKQYAADSEKNLQDSLNTKKQAYNNYYQDVISTIRIKQDEIANLMQKQPVRENDWGVVQTSKTKRNYRSSISQYEGLSKEVQEQKKNLKQSLDKNEITPEDFFMRNSELDAMQRSIDESIREVKDKQKMLVADFIQSIQMYLQEAMNAFNQIMNAVWDAEDVAFDKEQEQIDKDNEALEKALDKQQEIVEKHKDAIDDIEDELATSRGDRRQHLIDQLNAEIEAQRAAAAEEKRLQKEKEKQQAKQDELDKKRKKAQYKRDLLQAIVNGAMAVTYAAINAWPIPAIPMMALAGAATAAQIAIMASNKPYAKGGQLDGGVAVGNRHRDGGIKVLGGRAEIEGGEYITNRLTTAKNLDLLEYVNSKKKRIDISDMLEFYNSGKPRKAIQGVRTKFEDGGYIAPLPTELDIKDQLRDIYIMQDQRPVVVSVVDITNKQADVRRVQTLAGLSE